MSVCNGLGYKLEFDPDLVVPDPQRIADRCRGGGDVLRIKDSWTLTASKTSRAYTLSRSPWYRLDLVRELFYWLQRRSSSTWQNSRNSVSFR